MISTTQIEIKKTDNLTSSYIEQELTKEGFLPLRWAIVKVTENSYCVSVSYEKQID